MISPQATIAGFLSGPGMAPQSGGPGGLPAPGADTGEALPGNDFAWFMPVAGVPVALAPGAQGPIPVLPPGLLSSPPKFATGTAAAALAGGIEAANTGMVLPPSGHELPATAPGSAALPSVLAISSDGTAGPTPAPLAREFLAGLRGLRQSPQDAKPIEFATIDTGDQTALPDIRAGTAATGNRANQFVLPVPLPATPAQQPAFDQAVGQRLMLMINSGGQDARLRVYPETLGSIDIRLKLDGEEARLTLVSPHASVRDALELAVPRLRELLTDAGVGLAQVDVGAGDPQTAGESGFGRRAETPGSSAADPGSADAAEPVPDTWPVPSGLVDTFA